MIQVIFPIGNTKIPPNVVLPLPNPQPKTTAASAVLFSNFLFSLALILRRRTFAERTFLLFFFYTFFLFGFFLFHSIDETYVFTPLYTFAVLGMIACGFQDKATLNPRIKMAGTVLFLLLLLLLLSNNESYFRQICLWCRQNAL